MKHLGNCDSIVKTDGMLDLIDAAIPQEKKNHPYTSIVMDANAYVPLLFMGVGIE